MKGEVTPLTTMWNMKGPNESYVKRTLVQRVLGTSEILTNTQLLSHVCFISYVALDYNLSLELGILRLFFTIFLKEK